LVFVSRFKTSNCFQIHTFQEAKKIAEKEGERIRQIKAETEEWKKIQRSLESEAALRERERQMTEKMGKQAAKAIGKADFEKMGIDVPNKWRAD
jgi:hypothetical protein